MLYQNNFLLCYYQNLQNIFYGHWYPTTSVLQQSNQPETKKADENDGKVQSLLNIQYKNTQQKKIRESNHPNKRNIIHTLSKKIFKFLFSDEAKAQLLIYFPGLLREDINQYHAQLRAFRGSKKVYFGKKQLKKMWQRLDNPIFSKYSRMLSKWYLEKYCVSSVLLNKRIKPSLKIIHLNYRRKLMNHLNTLV